MQPADTGQFSDVDLRVVIGYENFESGVRAMRIYKRVLEPALGKCQLRIWKFEPLGIPEILREASADAARADFIIVSIAGDRPLPAEAVSWLESCTAPESNPDGALLLVTEQSRQASPAALLASAFLEQIARNAKLRYFAPPGCLSTAGLEAQRLGFRNNLVEAAVLHSSRYDRWGLNE